MILSTFPTWIRPSCKISKNRLRIPRPHGRFCKDNNNGEGSYYSYGDSIPTYLPLPDQSWYNLAATTNTNFSVKFTTGRATWYTTEWKNAMIDLTVFASPDSTSFNAQSFITALKSKLLRGQDLAGLSLNNFSFSTAQGMDYAGYTNYTHNPAQTRTQRIPTVIGFTKSF